MFDLGSLVRGLYLGAALSLAACGSEAPVSVPLPTSSGGCITDNDCKGERVCRGGKCVEPNNTIDNNYSEGSDTNLNSNNNFDGGNQNGDNNLPHEMDLCYNDDVCKPSMICNNFYGNGECRYPGLTSDRCKENEDCTEGYYCTDWLVGESDAVQDRERRCYSGQRGEPCRLGSFGDGRLYGDEMCVESLICHRYPPSRPPNANAWSEWEEECQPPSRVGEPCVIDQDCDSELICNNWYEYDREGPNYNECHPPSGIGEPCFKDDADCLEGLVCNYWYAGDDNNTEYPECHPPGREGEGCTENQNDCAEGFTCEPSAGFTDDSGVCVRE